MPSSSTPHGLWSSSYTVPFGADSSSAPRTADAVVHSPMLRHVALIVLESVLIEPNAPSMWTNRGSVCHRGPKRCTSMTVAHEGKLVYSFAALAGGGRLFEPPAAQAVSESTEAARASRGSEKEERVWSQLQRSPRAKIFHGKPRDGRPLG